MTSTPTIELKRHYRGLSAKETDDLIADLADMIVNSLKVSSEHVSSMHGTQSGTVEDRHEAQSSTWDER